ncbi:MAG: methionyl-tRNA formyltransferase [Treponema sp.]|nr:methionyl-tRNA formyltransferase [Treponema sp.]
MRILFAASAGIAAPALRALARLCESDSRFELAALLTNPDSPRGRAGAPEPTDCARAFAELGSAAPILKPERLGAEARDAIAALRPDILASFAYGKIFGPKFLALFPLGGVNAHPSLLPKYRGPSPIPAAILGMERETGVSIQRIARDVDSGDLLLQEKIPLDGGETTESLSLKAGEMAARLMTAALRGLADGSLQGAPQSHGEATFCGLIEKSEGLIDWSLGAREIEARARAFTPWPLCWTMHSGRQLFMLEARAVAADSAGVPGEVLGKDEKAGILIGTGNGALAVSRLQYQAKKALGWKDFLNGARNFIGERLG